MLELNNFAAVIFDMDGLVLDSEVTYFNAWQEAARLMGYDLPLSFWQEFSGLHYPAIEQKLLAACGRDFDLRAFGELSGHCWRTFVQKHGIQTRPGFWEFVALVQKHALPYALATNSPSANTYQCLELAGLSEVFSVIVARDDVAHGKPDPAVFLQAAAFLKVPVANCLILEDSHSGIQAATRAGGYAVYIPSGPVPDPEAAALCDLQVDSLEQLVHCPHQAN